MDGHFMNERRDRVWIVQALLLLSVFSGCDCALPVGELQRPLDWTGIK